MHRPRTNGQENPEVLDACRLAGDSRKVARALRYNEQMSADVQLEKQIPPVQEGSQFRCRGQQMDVVTGHS